MDEGRRALAYGLKILTGRDHSEAEFRRKLTARDFAEETIEGVVARLKGLGYLDDGRFARIFAESALRNGRGYGWRLKAELARRGVSDEIIGLTLGRLGAEYDELAMLADLLARKFAGFDPEQADDRQKRRVIGYFQRRGFSLAAILKTLRDEGY